MKCYTKTGRQEMANTGGRISSRMEPGISICHAKTANIVSKGFVLTLCFRTPMSRSLHPYLTRSKGRKCLTLPRNRETSCRRETLISIDIPKIGVREVAS